MNKIDLFKTKVDQHRFLEAAGVAESLSLSPSNSNNGWEEISAFLLTYHGKLYSFGPQPYLFNKSKSEVHSITENLHEQNVGQESLRVNELLERANKHFEYALILECYKGYYYLINQDGLNVCVQLCRAIILAESITPDSFAQLNSNLKSIINQSVGSSEVGNGEIALNESYPFSIYVEFDRFVQQISSLLNIDLVECFNLYKPHLLIDG